MMTSICPFSKNRKICKLWCRKFRVIRHQQTKSKSQVTTMNFFIFTLLERLGSWWELNLVDSNLTILNLYRLPKAAVITHSRYIYIASAIHKVADFKDQDIFYSPLPLYHTAAGCMVKSNEIKDRKTKQLNFTFVLYSQSVKCWSLDRLSSSARSSPLQLSSPTAPSTMQR